jgi:hypothetical protein
VNLDEALQATAPAEPVRRDRQSHPKGWEPGYESDGSRTTITTPPLLERPTTWDAFIIDSGLDPAEVRVDGKVNVRGWDTSVASIDPETGKRVSNLVKAHYYRFDVVRLADDAPDLRQLYIAARAKSRAKPKEPPPVIDTATVVLWADPQTGKVARRGGTQQLIERQQQYLEGVDAYCKAAKSDAAYLFDLGDIVEGFENTPAQEHTNDLSIMDQVDIAMTMELEAVKTLAVRHNRVVVAGVGSNHCRWRRGKAALGLPGDDWGIFALKQLRKSLALNPDRFGHVSVTWPDKHEETMSLDVAGTIVGLAHGHGVNRPEQIPEWWGRQVHGGQPIAHADILYTGHFHTFRVQPSGMNPHTGRSKWWFQAPTMDNGSDWFRLLSGSDADAGLLLMQIDRNGWVRDSLQLL